jgi:type IV pilus assembly protein PilM
VARRLIGLDIGTNAVRVVEIEPAADLPLVTTFGQVALPPGAMRDGEVVDRAAVAAAIQRLWKELSLRKGEVRVGVASTRVLVRTLDLPMMSESDLAGALRFQAQELIPIPLEDAVLDFQVLEDLPVGEPGPDGAPPAQMQRILLAAAHKDTVGNLVAAVRAAGLTVNAVDLVPLALIRAIGRRVADEGVGAEAIVSVGGGVTVMVVHEAGLPRFVRVLGLGGRILTDAIARDLEIPFEQAEALKRQTEQAPEQIAERARAAMTRPLAELVEQIRGSLDYYRAQPGAPRLLRVTLTGGASLTPGLAPQLGALVGLPVELATPRDHLAMGDIGFPSDRVETLDPYLPTPAGLALGGLASGRRINLLGPEGRAAATRQRSLMIAGAIGALLVVLLVGVWWLRKSAVDTEKDRLSQGQSEVRTLEAQKASLADAATTQAEVDNLKAEAEAVLAQDVSWARMLQEIARTIPNDTWLTAFQGTSAANDPTSGGSSLTPSTPTSPSTTPSGSSSGAEGGATTTTTTPGSTGSTGATGATGGATPPPTSGTATFTVVGLDFRSVAAWIQRIGTQIPVGPEREPRRRHRRVERPDVRELLVDGRHHGQGALGPAREVPEGHAVKRTTLIACIAGGVVLILLWYFVLFSPTSKDLNDTRDQVSQVEDQKQELQNTIRHLKELSANAPQQQASLRTLRAAIPANPDLGEFILQANDIAAAAGIDWLSIAPSPPVATTGVGPASTITVAIQVDGGFFEVLDYLNRLEDMDRLVLVDSINVSSGGAASGGDASTGVTSGTPDLSVTLTGRMFTGAEAPSADGSVTPTNPTSPNPPSGGSTTNPTTPPASSSGTSS